MEGYQFVLEPIPFEPTEPVEVDADGDLLNHSEGHLKYSYFDSLLYVMLPSLITFCTVLVGFYLLHEFTTQAQLMGLRQSIIQKASALRATVCNVSPGEQAETVGSFTHPRLKIAESDIFDSSLVHLFTIIIIQFNDS